MAHGAGPGAGHPLGGDVAVVEDAQGGGELLLEEGAAAALVGEGRGRRDDRDGAAALAVEALEAPDRGDDGRVDAVAGLQGAEGGAVGGVGGAALGDALVGDGDREVVLEGARGLGLVAVAGDGAGEEAGGAEGGGEGLRRRCRATRRGRGRRRPRRRSRRRGRGAGRRAGPRAGARDGRGAPPQAERARAPMEMPKVRLVRVMCRARLFVGRAEARSRRVGPVRAGHARGESRAGRGGGPGVRALTN